MQGRKSKQKHQCQKGSSNKEEKSGSEKQDEVFAGSQRCNSLFERAYKRYTDQLLLSILPHSSNNKGQGSILFM